MIGSYFIGRNGTRAGSTCSGGNPPAPNPLIPGLESALYSLYTPGRGNGGASAPDQHFLYAWTLRFPEETELTPAYCMAAHLTGPRLLESPYITGIPSEILHEIGIDLTPNEILQLGYILGNFFPATTAQQTMNNLGISAGCQSQMTPADVYFAVQTAIWKIVDPTYMTMPPEGPWLVSCEDGDLTPNPKDICFRTVSLAMSKAAQAYANAALAVAAPVVSRTADMTNTRGCKAQNATATATLRCCYTPQMPIEECAIDFGFTGCPTTIQEACGGMMIGPFRLTSSVQINAAPVIEPVPFLACDMPSFSYVIVDADCNPINPAMDEDFYIVVQSNEDSYCFALEARVTLDVPLVIIARHVPNPYEPETQSLCTVKERLATIADVGMSICVNIKRCPPCPPCPKRCPRPCPKPCPPCPRPCPPCPKCPVSCFPHSCMHTPK